jgi:hypothetical protein
MKRRFTFESRDVIKALEPCDDDAERLEALEALGPVGGDAIDAVLGMFDEDEARASAISCFDRDTVRSCDILEAAEEFDDDSGRRVLIEVFADKINLIDLPKLLATFDDDEGRLAAAKSVAMRAHADDCVDWSKIAREAIETFDSHRGKAMRAIMDACGARKAVPPPPRSRSASPEPQKAPSAPKIDESPAGAACAPREPGIQALCCVCAERLCDACAAKMKSSVCPICRALPTGIVKIYDT